MISKAVDAVTTADIEDLVTAEVREGRSLDYKAQLPGRSDGEKKEFLQDVCSFANAAGGNIVYGVTERRDGDRRNTGIPDRAAGLEGVNADEEVRRLEQMLLASVDPRIPGVRLRVLDGFASGPCILLHIPRSWIGPHMVSLNRDSRFYSRNSAGKYPLDVRELRSAFGLAGQLRDGMRKFRDERLSRVIADDTPVRLGPGPRAVLHLVPLAALDAHHVVDVWQHEKKPLPPVFTAGGWNHRYSIDGFTTWSGREDAKAAYLLALRNGALEAVHTSIGPPSSSQRLFNPWGLEAEVVAALTRYLDAMRSMGVEPPFFVAFSLLSVKGFAVPLSPRRNRGGQVNERDTLILPDILLEHFHADLPAQLRVAFDAMWQAFGLARSYCFDGGRWSAPEFNW
jgi:hypothetical protein